MSKRKNVVVFVREFLPYSETFIYNQIKTLAKVYNVHVVCERLSQQQFYVVENIHVLTKNLELYRLYNKRNYHKARFINSWKKKRQLQELLSDLKPQALICHFVSNALLLDSIIPTSQFKLIIFAHGYDCSQLLNNSKFYRKKFYKLSETASLIFVSKGLKRIASSYFEKEVPGDQLYLGVNTDFFKRTKFDSAANSFVQVSSFNPKKGHAQLIEAVARVIPTPRLTFIGDGPTLPEIKRIVSKFNLQAFIKFKGRLSSMEIRTELEAHRYFIHPSITAADGNSEGLPVSIIEAMSMEMPIVSTYHSGIPEIVENNVNGLLVDEGDVASLATAIERIQEWSFLKRNRLKVMKQHNQKNELKALIEIVEKT